MLRRLDAPTEMFLTDLREISRRLDKAEREVTSGRRINEVSDDPDQISTLLQIRAELNQTQQIRANLGRVKTEVDAGEQALEAAAKVMDRAAVLGTQGANGTETADQRRIIAGEVEALIKQMTGLTGTKVEGRYIFSGDADKQAPYTLDLSLDDPYSDYQGGAATREVMHPTGALFAISKTAQEIFDNPDPSKNVLDALNNLRLALRNNDDAAIGAALDQITSAGVHLNNELAFYGTVQDQVAEATDFASKQEVRLKTQISNIEDADMTASILALNQARYQHEVALSSKAKLKKVSLFDYLG